MRIELNAGYIAQIDDEDHELVSPYTWIARVIPRSDLVYAYRCWREDGRKRAQLMHSLLTGWTLVDHRNHDGLDNRRSNLREATPSQNQGNRRPNLNGSSIYKGVSRDCRSERWIVQCGGNKATKWVGSYVDEVEAARAYDAAALLRFGEFALLNFPAPVAVS